MSVLASWDAYITFSPPLDTLSPLSDAEEVVDGEEGVVDSVE